MSRNISNKSAVRGKGSPLLIGILVGILIGAALAASLAWYILKSPNPFLPKAQVDIQKPLPDTPKPGPATSTGPGASSDGKPRFEFYKVLTDKQDATLPAAGKSGDQSKGGETSQAVPGTADKEIYYLQAGSFSNEDDAEKLKAKLALLGMEANIQTVTIPDKGVWHRVRTGPYQNSKEMNDARAALKQNGMDVTPMRAQ